MPTGPVTARLAAPPSKSVTNRALACAALAAGVSTLRSPLDSDDAAAMRAAVTALGATVTGGTDAWQVQGVAGRPASPPRPVDCRQSGTTLRFVTALAALTERGATLTGHPQLLRRPVGPLVAALAALGAPAADRDGYPPVTVHGGGLRGGRVLVEARRSSQFASAVLLAAPLARGPVLVEAAGVTASGYVELTAEVMRAFGAQVTRAGPAAWQVTPGGYRACEYEVEHDASAAAHLFALAAATGGQVTVTNARAGSRQPDAALPELLARMGAVTARDGAALTVTGPDRLAPVDADLGGMPDQVTTVAALCALAEGTSRLRNLSVVREHESDRLAALATELGKLGAAVEELPDGLVIHGGLARLGPARLDPHGDHRLAMAFAAVAARVPGVVITDPACVAKTYPGFWQDLARAGLAWRLRSS